MSQMVQCLVFGALLSWGGNRKMKGVMARPNPKDLDFLGELLASGRIVPVIDRCYPFRETAEAMRYVLKGHVRGKVVLTNDN